MQPDDNEISWLANHESANKQLHRRTHTLVQWAQLLAAGGLLIAAVLLIVVIVTLLPWIRKVKKEVKELRARADADLTRARTIEANVTESWEFLDTKVRAFIGA